MANIAAQRIKREFKEVIKSEEVSESDGTGRSARAASARARARVSRRDALDARGIAYVAVMQSS
jgi:hypothetical protein